MSVSEFKVHCLAVLAAVSETGEPVMVTDGGEPIAEIVPASRPPEVTRVLGSLNDSGRITGDIMTPLGRDAWGELS